MANRKHDSKGAPNGPHLLFATVCRAGPLAIVGPNSKYVSISSFNFLKDCHGA